MTNRTILQLSAPLAVAPTPGAVWILEIATIEAQQFRVLQVTENHPGEMTLTALAYNPSKYNAIEDGTTLTVQSISDLTQPPVPPAFILVQESLYSFQSTIFSQAEISWENVSGAIAYQIGYRKDSGQWVYVTGIPANAYTINKADPGSYDIRVWSIGSSQRLSQSYAEVVTTLYGKTLPPSDVVGLTYGFDASLGLILSWAAAPDIDIAAYEIRLGATWGTAQYLARTNSTEYIVGTDYAVDANVFLVKVLDTQGIYSTNAASVSVVIPAATPLVLAAAFVGTNVVLNWNTVTGPLNIDHYEVRTDTNFKTGGAGLIATVKGTAYTLKALFAGSKTFYVAAIDIGGNVASSGSATLTIVLPTITGITTQIVDNNVLLRWTSNQGTLPIDHYILTTGAALASGGTLVGTTSGIFAAFFETVAGSYTYFIQAVDVAGNLGPAFSVTATVNQPPDYVLHYNLDSTFSGTLTNAITVNGVMTMPVDTTSTFEEHFTSHSWGAPQDQINAGDTLFIEPSPGSATYVELIDYGAQLSASSILVTPTISMTIGSPAVAYKIETSPDGTTWTAYAGLACYANAFRYMRFTITVTGGATDLIAYQGINYKYQVKKKNDNGSVACNASDANGTPAVFNIAFIDVQSIQVTAAGTSNVTAIYAFDGAADPTQFTIYLFNSATGARVSGTASWSAQGV